MFKKVLSTTVLSVSILAAMTANAAVPDVTTNVGTSGIYVTGQIGYADTGSDLLVHYYNLPDKQLLNNGLAGRVALGYQFNQNFAVEAGYLHLGSGKVDFEDPTVNNVNTHDTISEKIKQRAVDLVGKGIIPISSNANVYAKFGVAYISTDIKGTETINGNPPQNHDLNDYYNIAKHNWATEAAVGVSYNITPNLSVDTSWTHIQPLGNKKPGNINFVAVGLGYNFG